MGLKFSKMFDEIWDVPPRAFLMVGLSGAGKNTIMTQLKLGDMETTYPLPGFELKTVEYKDLTFKVFDLEGSGELRNQWKVYTDYAKSYNLDYNIADAVIFVVDSSDHGRIDEARRELEIFMNEGTVKDAHLLVFANKKDLPNAMNAAEITDKLGLRSLKQAWYIQSTSAPSSAGIYEGFEWLSNTFRKGGAR